MFEATAMKQGARTFALVAFALATGSISMGYSPSAGAQLATVKPGAGDDLRAAYANAADVADGKGVADTTCAGCHGANGISSIKDVPNLAGQRPSYLYLELRAYQSGARGDSTMGAVVKVLTDNALVKAAAYYASLDPAQPSSTSSAKPTAAPPDPVQAGKAAAAVCAGCHGDSGISKIPGTPSLVGLDPKYLVAAMTAYKNGQRKNDTMKAMLASVGEGPMNNIAIFYALQKPERAKSTAGGDP